MTWRVLPLALGVALFSEACVAVPVAGRTSGTSRAKEEGVERLLQTGVTTREEVLFAFGEPDDVVGVGRGPFATSGREWKRWVGILLINPATIVGPMPFWTEKEVADYTLEIEFDERGIVKRVERQALGARPPK